MTGPQVRRDELVVMSAEVARWSDRQPWLTLMGYRAHLKVEIRRDFCDEIVPKAKEFNRLASELRVRPYYRGEEEDFETIKQIHGEIQSVRSRWF